jgi:hypothetical protein
MPSPPIRHKKAYLGNFPKYADGFCFSQPLIKNTVFVLVKSDVCKPFEVEFALVPFRVVKRKRIAILSDVQRIDVGTNKSRKVQFMLRLVSVLFQFMVENDLDVSIRMSLVEIIDDLLDFIDLDTLVVRVHEFFTDCSHS